MKFILFFPFFLFCSFLLIAQNFQISNQKSFGGSEMDMLTSVTKCNDGGYIIGARTMSGVSGNKITPLYGFIDFWIIKTDEVFNIEWQKSYGGQNVDEIAGIVQDTYGNYYIGGTLESVNGNIGGNITVEGMGDFNFLLVKLDSEGNEVWQKSYGGNNWEIMSDIVISNDNIYLIGSSNSDISGNKSEECRGEDDYWIICIDTNGDLIWEKTAGGTKSDVPLSTCLDNNGDFLYVIGSSYSNAGFEKSENNYNTYKDLWLLKINSADGTIIADKTFGSFKNDIADKIIFHEDDLYISSTTSGDIGGDKSENAKGESDAWILKLDNNLNIIWDKTIGGAGIETSFDIVVIENNSLCLLGSSNSPVSFDKTEPPLGSYTIMGELNYFKDYWLVAIDDRANILWDKTIGSEGNDLGISLIYNEQSSSLICIGSSAGEPSAYKTSLHYGDTDVWIFEMSIPTESHNLINDKKYSFYPNPASNILHFSSAQSFEIIDIQGRILKQSATEQDFVDISELKNGMYFIKLENRLYKFVKN